MTPNTPRLGPRPLHPSVLFLLAALLLSGGAPAMGQVVATLRPLHSLAAGVMEGVDRPHLLFRNAASPHGMSLKPSQARMLLGARVVFWGGPVLEPSLARPLAQDRAGRLVVALDTAPGVRLLPARPAGIFRHGGGGDEPGEEDGHGEAERHEPEAAHGHGTADPHFWLDPRNGRALVAAMAAALSRADPAHRETYLRNAGRMQAALRGLEVRLRHRLAPLGGRPYVLYHDAYQYFEARFGLRPLGALMADEGHPPGARRVRRFLREIRDRNVGCVFAAPLTPPRLRALLSAPGVRAVGLLDPTGFTLEPGAGLYSRMLLNMAESLEHCLGAPR